MLSAAYLGVRRMKGFREMTALRMIFLGLGALFIAPQILVADPVFRDPFVLRLYIDKEHIYEEEYGPIPYVHEGDIYLFRGDAFGVNFDADSSTVSYEPSLAKANLTFTLTQEVDPDGTSTMLLIIANRSGRRIELDALMTVPGKKEIFRTTILPVADGKSNYEAWPHTIVQLVFTNIRATQ